MMMHTKQAKSCALQLGFLNPGGHQGLSVLTYILDRSPKRQLLTL